MQQAVLKQFSRSTEVELIVWVANPCCVAQNLLGGLPRQFGCTARYGN
jgi:hypothetical protein